MASLRRLALVDDPRYREHRGPRGHPERPDRLVAVAEAIDAFRGSAIALPARPASDDEILRVHERSHLARIAKAAAAAPTHLDPDTFMCERSLEVARLAAGGAVDAARAVARGEAAAGLAAIRPPGHHAEAGRAMGFCLFNNVAIAARALQADEGLERLLILDWDVHHGNGTQHSFESDPSVLYFSTHQFPFYPGTGDVREAGAGRGEGTTVNAPLPAGSGDAELVGALQRLLVPVARHFRPDAILVSAGFDAHRDDPLAELLVSGDGYAAMAGIVRRLADELCGGRLVLILEGGYALSGLREGVAAVLDAVLAPEPPPLPPPSPAPEGSVLGTLVERSVAVHGRRVPDLGAA